MSSRRNSSIPKEDVVFPRMLYCDSRFSQMLTGLSPALPGALLCNATRCLGDGKRVILPQRVRGSVRAVRAVQNTRVFQTETRYVADESHSITASKCLSKLARSQPRSVSVKPHHYGLQTRSIMASQCISKLARSRSRSASRSSLDHGLQLYLQIRLITASKFS